MKKAPVILLLSFATACSHRDLRTTFNNHRFDEQVIEKLPIYDSLVRAVIEHYPKVEQFNYDKNAYRYVPSQDGDDLYKVFPSEIGNKIKQQLAKLGPNFIYGFDCYKDTTIRIMVRDSQKDHINIRERLSYFPAGTNIKRREYPIKDTILNAQWQYWIAFDEEFFN
jgi:hypothetical protein